MVDKARRTAFACQQCGYVSPRWLGQCSSCGAWGSMMEEALADPKARGAASSRPSTTGVTPRPLAAVTTQDSIRRSTGLGELDRVLGGGLVQGAGIPLGRGPARR